MITITCWKCGAAVAFPADANFGTLGQIMALTKARHMLDELGGLCGACLVESKAGQVTAQNTEEMAK